MKRRTASDGPSASLLGTGVVATIVLDTGAVLATWMLYVALENLVVGIGQRDQFVGSWEMGHARLYLSPIAMAVLVPFAVLTVVLGHIAAARRSNETALAGFLAGVLLAYGVSTGRHFASWTVRGPFLVVTGVALGAFARILVRRAPLDRPRQLAILGAVVAAIAWCADVYLLPRLYPALHLALLALSLASAALVALSFRHTRAGRGLGLAAVALCAVFALWAPRAAKKVAGDDNLRRVLVERAPVLGRAVLVAGALAPPAPLEEGAAGSDAAMTAALVHPGSTTRTLDWTGRDIVLVSVDALRADHVGVYGYPRATTPNIDRLAARGVRFDRAYCPTPHTSYSVTSMMTGKYMRPLLSLGGGGAAQTAHADDASETWATYLRHYGFRTAAFYPPAVFFIDGHRFRGLEAQGLGFEYRKVEFAPPELRRAQVAEYVAHAPKDKPLFLWVHLFEPHEPYVRHPEHPFQGNDKVDAYDSEIAAADATIGAVVAEVEKRRPGAVVIVTADHGEEFGDHGGRYHGTTVYEEQVRVPLVVVGPGVEPRVLDAPVQTIDLLPTTLSALDVPLPARVRGRDLGPMLANRASAADAHGLAFAETDDYTLVARDNDRLVCLRKIASCTLFDVARDPAQKTPVLDRPERVQELRRLTAAIERENGKLEVGSLPESLRRGLQGDREAAEDVATLLDDARVTIRREAARCLFQLDAVEGRTQLERALAKDEDLAVRQWAALALVRRLADARAPDAGTDAGTDAGSSDAGTHDRAAPGAAAAIVDALLHDSSARLRLAAAIALASRRDGRGEAELVKRWQAAFVPGAEVLDPTLGHGELAEARDILDALGTIGAKSAPPVLVRSLEDVRVRPYVVDALARIGVVDKKSRDVLLTTFANERYVHLRAPEARALVTLGARDELRAPLERFAGVPEGMPEAIVVAREAGLLERPSTPATLVAKPKAAVLRLVIETTDEAEAAPSGTLGGRPLPAPIRRGKTVWTFDDLASDGLAEPRRGAVEVRLDGSTSLRAIWLVARAEEIPPPPPQPYVPDGVADGPEGGL